MLNYVWLALVVVGILTAAGRDVHDMSVNAYGNGTALSLDAGAMSAAATQSRFEASVTLTAAQLQRTYPSLAGTRDSAVFTASVLLRDPSHGSAVLRAASGAPALFATMTAAQGSEGTLLATLERRVDGTWSMTFAPVRFVYLRKITTAAFDAAGVAVQIAIGLLGIMALWLGVMKVAEQAGLISALARLVRPLTVRLFPDVPHDHPAVGAILMNVSANMLGLGNAATPFGLKAMEELNSINPRAGTASNAMVTFLAMNTSCITLIPATAIAVRASLGSADPAAIIGTTLLASLTATIVGVTVARLLQRTRIFRLDPREVA